MLSSQRTVFVTGASGFLGSRALARLQERYPALQSTVLVRDPERFERAARTTGIDTRRVEIVVGDLRQPGLGLEPAVRERLRQRAGAVLHTAASTAFSQSLDEARATNVDGTRNLLDLAAEWPWVRRVTYVSSVCVAGTRTGAIPERPIAASTWVNAYEQSKHEAEALIRSCQTSWVILRPSTIVCESIRGEISHCNGLHRALRLYFGGLAPMIPGTEQTLVDVVPADYVAGAIARLALWHDVSRQTLHLCAGANALPLEDLLEITHACWSRSADWRSPERPVGCPEIVDLDTYRAFEESVAESGTARMRQVVRTLSHFVPQLAYPKRYETGRSEALLGLTAPAVRTFWRNMIERLSAGLFGSRARVAA